MSSIPNGIAGSLNQAALQQGQVSRANDAQQNDKAERTRKMKQLLEKHTSAVEDSNEAEAQHLQVRKQQQAEEEHRRKRQQQHEDQRDNVAPVGDDDPNHIDLTA